jgi:hypothetical protein
MSYWDYEEPYWEPSEADELFDEVKSKLINAAKDSIKSDMEYLRSENKRLIERNKELENKAYEVSKKERDLKYKADNLRREVEREFYKTSIEDVFKDALEKHTLWFADNKPHTRPKCDKCNSDRNWVLTWPNGELSTKQCDCARLDYWYEPQETFITTLTYRIRDSNYQSERYYRLDESHQNTSSSRYDSYSYEKFGIQFVYDEFCDDVIEKHDQLGWNKYIGFKTKEECQKFCDWLNKKKESDD